MEQCGDIGYTALLVMSMDGYMTALGTLGHDS